MPFKKGETPKGAKPFKKGQSGNPNGYPKGMQNFSTVLRKIAETKDKKAGGNGNPYIKPAIKLYELMDAKNEAVQLKSVQEFIDRLDGKVDENINLNTIEIPKIDISFRDAD